MSDLFKFASSMLPASTRVVGFSGHEAISQPYRFEVFVIAHSDAIDFDLNEAVNTRARLSIDAKKGPPFLFSGVLGSIDLLHEFGGRALLRAVIVPRLAELALSRHSRIFTKKSPLDVIKAVLEEGGVTDFEVHVGASAVEEHICQYRESDLDFISRWMEREGIRYYFEHGEEGEKLILSDNQNHPAEASGLPVRYYPQMGDFGSGAEASFRSFKSRHKNLSANVKLRDNDYAKPTFGLAGHSPVHPNGAGEINLYGERFFDPASGQRLAQVRAESIAAGQSTFEAMGPRLHLHAGVTFELEEHPRPTFNTKYLVTEAHHHGNQATDLDHFFQKMIGLEQTDVYLVDVTAIPAKTPYRPPSVTPWPRIYSFENAVVDGPASSEYAQIDAQGRYNVKFHFDEGPLKDGQASTFVRMMQPHGGGVEGFHFPLRKGTEIVVSFLGGDPDRPVISGVVPNALTPSPVTSGNHTKNIIQTGGHNRLEIEDLAGHQRITLSTPYANSYLRMGSPNDGHEMILHTDGNALHDTAVNVDIKTGGHKHEDVVGDVQETYHNTKTETVTLAVTENYNNIKTETVALALTENYNNTKTETVKGHLKETYKAGQEIHVTGTKTETVTDAVTETYQNGLATKVTGGNVTLDVDAGTYTVTVKGIKKELVKDDHHSTAEGNYYKEIKGSNETVIKGVNTSIVLGNSNSVIVGFSTSTLVGGSLTTVAGLKTDLLLGGSIAVNLGAKMDFTFGMKLDVLNGFKGEFTIGTHMKSVAVTTVDLGPVKFREFALEMALHPLKLDFSDLDIDLSDLQIIA